MRRRSAMVLALAVALVAGLGSGAVAYWSGAGSGSADAVLNGSQTLFLEPGTPLAELYPGGAADVALVARNPNAFAVRIGSLRLDSGAAQPFGVDSGHSGCDVAALSFIAADNGGDGWLVPPRSGGVDGSLGIELPAAIAMSATAANECQGASFSVDLEARP